jgi:hypothetical protein
MECKQTRPFPRSYFPFQQTKHQAIHSDYYHFLQKHPKTLRNDATETPSQREDEISRKGNKENRSEPGGKVDSCYGSSGRSESGRDGEAQQDCEGEEGGVGAVCAPCAAAGKERAEASAPFLVVVVVVVVVVFREHSKFCTVFGHL